MDITQRIKNKIAVFCADNGITDEKTAFLMESAALLGANAVYEKQAEEDEAIIQQENREFAKVFEKARRQSNPDAFDMPDLSRQG